MKLKKDYVEMIRNAANDPDGAKYYKEIIRELKSSSIIAIISMIVAILSMVIALIALFMR